MNRSRLASASIWALAVPLAIAGCGGGSGSSGPHRLSPQKLIAQSSPGVVEINGKLGTATVGGSGFVYDAKKDLVVTNAHVVEGLSSITVKVGDQLPPVPAHVVGTAPCSDVAVIQLEAPGKVHALPLGNSDKVKRGQHVTVLGYPGNFQNFRQQSVASTEGSVSNPALIGNEISVDLPRYPSLIQHTAAVNHGDSGGPLLDDFGRVIGINTLTRSGQEQSQGQFYSIAIDEAKKLLPQLESGNNPADVGWSAAPLASVPPVTRVNDYINSYGMSVHDAIQNVKYDQDHLQGLYVTGIDPGSPSDNKVYEGDLIDEINATPVKTVPQECKILQSAAPGSTLQIHTIGLTSFTKYTPDYSKASSTVEVKVPTANTSAGSGSPTTSNK